MRKKTSPDSGQQYYPLPADVARATPLHNASNFGLLFHRFIAYPKNAKNTSMVWQFTGKEKARLWKQLVNRADQILLHKDMRVLYTALRERRNLLEEACRTRFGPSGVKTFTLEIEWRLALGLSAGSVLDTGMSLHRVYGVPWLASSAIKGAARSYALEMAANKLGLPRLTLKEINERRQSRKAESRKTSWDRLEQLLLAPAVEFEEHWRALVESSEFQCVPSKELNSASDWLLPIATDFRAIFGTPQERGQVIFFDAMPESLVVQNKNREESLLELDIINPHYSNYYRNPQDPPSDYSEPIPVNFLTVRGGAKFCFLLASNSPRLAEQAEQWLKAAAQDIGLGAKTMAGYGAMQSPNAKAYT